MLELLTHFTKFAEAAAAEPEGVAVLGIDIKVILLQAGTFLILFFIIKKFALENIVSTLEQRRKTIDKGIDLGIEMKKKKSEFDGEIKKLQQAARAEADNILVQAHQEAGEIIKAGEVMATTKADGVMKDASARIEREMQTARKELRGEMLSLVSEATEVIIGEKLDAKKDGNLIERALSRVRA